METSDKIKACIFDLGGVVLGSPLEGIAFYEKKYGIPPGFVNICIVTKGRESSFSKLERGQLELNKFYEEFRHQLADPAQVEAYVNFLQKKGRPVPQNLPKSVEIDTEELFKTMMDRAAKVNPDMLHALGVLRGSGYKVAALTNNWQMDGDGPKDSSSTNLLDPFFDLIIESSIVGLRKPDPKIYKLVCDEIGVSFEESTFLDDIGMNVKAAKKLGMGTVKVDIGETKKALDELKIILGKPELRLYPDENVNSIPTTLTYNCGGADGQQKIAVDVYGEMSNPIVLFFHGGGQTRHSWRATAQQFASKGYCAMTVDLKGHGDSYWDPAPDSDTAYSLESYGADVDSLLYKLHLSSKHKLFKKPILVGASLGGIAILNSEQAKRSAEAIVLVDIAPRMESEGVSRITSWMLESAYSGFGSIEEVVEAVKAYNPHGKEKGKNSSENLKRNLILKEDGRYYWHWDPKFLKGHEATHDKEKLDAIEEHNNNLAKLITCPCLLVRGNKTDVLSAEGVESFRSIVKHAEFVNVADAGHMVAGDQNTLFADSVLSFVERIRNTSKL